MEENFIINSKLRDGIVNYLNTKPHLEVRQIIDALLSLDPIQLPGENPDK